MNNTQILKWNNKKSNRQKHNFMSPSPLVGRQLIIGSTIIIVEKHAYF